MSRPVNIYELLDDDSSSGQKGPAQKPKSNTAQPVQTSTKTTTQQVNRAPARTQDNRKPREENRGGFSEQVSDRKPRAPREPRESKGGFTEVRAPRNPNQRQYDRKSGTGRGRENKRSGGGRGNWGSINDEAKPVLEEGEEKTTQEAQPTEAAPAVDTTTDAPATEAPAEEEEKVKTLDEYLSTIKKVNLSLPAPRQPGEGQEVSPQWASYTALKKDDEEVAKTGEKKKAESKESSKQTISADQVIHFKESPKGGSFRGGRGGRGGRRGGEGSPRGGRGEGSPRGGRGGQKRGGGAPGARAPGLTEENFPALKA